MIGRACKNCRYWRKGQGVTSNELGLGWGGCTLLTDEVEGHESSGEIPEGVAIGAYGGAVVATSPDFFCAEFRR